MICQTKLVRYWVASRGEFVHRKVTIDIDVDAIAAMLAPRAYRSKRGKARYMKGAIVVQRVTES